MQVPSITIISIPQEITHITHSGDPLTLNGYRFITITTLEETSGIQLTTITTLSKRDFIFSWDLKYIQCVMTN